MNSDEVSAWRLRRANVGDIATLVALRRLMFVSMGYTDEPALDRMAGASARYLARALPSGELRAWVADVDGQIVGCGAVVIHSAPPTVRNLAGGEGYIMNLVTLPGWRRRGIATAILNAILDELRAEGVPVASLHASAEGRAMYERAGFAASNEMRKALTGDR